MIQRAFFIAFVLFSALAGRVWADRAANLEALTDALGLPEVVEIMREEGLTHGEDLARDMFPGRAGSGWARTVSRIYDAETMRATVAGRLDQMLYDEDIAPLLEFFASDRGRRIIAYEVSARRALMDEDIEAAAREAYRAMRDTDNDRLELIDAFVEANDLVASNVMGAMNSNYAFYLGLADGDALPSSMTEGDILSEVWSQEDEIRIDTEEWVFSYLAMAYKPLDDADLEAYIALSQSEEGQALNRALFDGFDEMYNAISRAMGTAAERMLASEDI
ncbi:MAG: DUF2059 domain-containing protein [Pseudomonadota bacterium]